MHDTVIDQLVSILVLKTEQSLEPMTQEIVYLYGKNPYLVLVSCLLSLQTRDLVTLPVSKKLFERAKTVDEILALPLLELEQIIKPINYYKTKAQRIKSISHILKNQYAGQVPASLDKLLAIKGIGLKTANLVLAEAFDIPAICVDTHVHRLSNHWGLINTKTPEQTERALRKILPQKHWIVWNRLLVKWGQSICKKNINSCQKCQQLIDLVQNHR